MNMNKENKFLGYMHIDKRPYKELAKTVSRWIKRGDVVKRIIRYENDFFSRNDLLSWK